MASSGAHFAKETKMVQIRGTEIFKSMSGIYYKREAMSSRNKSNIRLYVFQPYTKKAWSKSFGIDSIGNESFGCSEVKGAVLSHVVSVLILSN